MSVFLGFCALISLLFGGAANEDGKPVIAHYVVTFLLFAGVVVTWLIERGRL